MAKHDEIFESILSHPIIDEVYDIIVRHNGEDLSDKIGKTIIEPKLIANHPDQPILNAVRLLVKKIELDKKSEKEVVSLLLKELND